MSDPERDMSTDSLAETATPIAVDHLAGDDPLIRARSSGRTLAFPLAGGWASQLLVLVMLFAAGMAIHDLRPAGLPAGPGATAWLPWLMVAAGLISGLLAATRLRAGSVDLLTALVGTGVGLVVVAGAVSDASSLVDRFEVLETSIGGALADLLVERVPSAEQAPFLLTLSALAWTTGAYAAISVGRYARASGAIVPIGLMLLVPVIAAELRGQDGGQILWLAIGVVAALLLVLRLNLERQRVRWLRRHVAGGRSVGRSFLGGGALLVSVVTVAAIGLTAVMGAAPLAAGWDRLGSVLGDLGLEVGQLRQPSTRLSGAFPDTMRLGDRWVPQDRLFFTALTEGPHYWRGKVYDTFDGREWHRSDGVSLEVPQDEDLLGATADIESDDAGAFTDVEAIITLQEMAGRDLVAPQNPAAADVDTRIWSLGPAGPFQVLESQAGLASGDQYTVFASEPDLALGGLTERMLATLGEDPDPEWIEPFLVRPEAGVGPLTRETAGDIKGDLPRRDREDRYQLASAVQRYLTSSPFEYSTDLAGTCRPGQTITDCLLESHLGFCERYATTMVMLLRELKVPARYVVGFLPGTDTQPGLFEVTGSASHAWVEVWFNGFGWLRFDPTPGASSAASDLLLNGQEQTVLPEGEPTLDPEGPDGTFPADGTSGPDETFGPEGTEEPSPEPSGSPSGVTRPGGGIGSLMPPVALLLAGTGLAATLVLAGAFLWFRRLPRGGAEHAWQGITSIATRFGRGPAPSQTPYEYGVTLSRVVPRVAQDIRTVADAKVSATYGPDGHDVAEPAALRGAYARARTGLLTLLLRRRR